MVLEKPSITIAYIIENLGKTKSQSVIQLAMATLGFPYKKHYELAKSCAIDKLVFVEESSVKTNIVSLPDHYENQ